MLDAAFGAGKLLRDWSKSMGGGGGGGGGRGAGGGPAWGKRF